jgi:hypothetical protein
MPYTMSQALEKLRQDDRKFRVSGCVARPCLKIKMYTNTIC